MLRTKDPTPPHNRPPRAGRARRAGGALLVAALVAAGCATNPVTGKRELSLVTEGQEIATGRETRQAIDREYGVDEHKGWASRVDSIGQAMARISHRPDLPWEFHVLDDPTVNAFAAPGGFIYVTRGILAHFNSEAQLAGVLGHELGHVTARHYARMASRQQVAGVGLLVGSVFSETLARYGGLAQQGLQLLFLKYSRDQEEQSDALGVDYALRIGFDPREMPATYRTLARISERAGQRIPTYLSTHPDPGAREETVRGLAVSAVGARTGLVVNRDGFLRDLDGLKYGVDPREGYFEGTRFYHPGLRFVLDFPAGWQTMNTRTAVLAGTEDGSAAMQLTLAAAGTATPAAYVEQLLRERRIAGANGGPERIRGFDAWLGRVSVTDANGRSITLAAAFLRHTPEAMYQFLGQVPDAAADRAFFATVRSFDTLSDAGRLSPVPARIRVVQAPRTGTFQDLVPGLGAQGISLEETAILNGMELDDTLERGRWIKIVTPARLR